MAIFHDSNCILDTHLLVSLEKGQGHGASDGVYYLHAIFAIGRRFRDGCYFYESEDKRNAAFLAICALIDDEETEYEVTGHDNEQGTLPFGEEAE